MHKSSRLALYHFWVAFGLFVPAVLLGAWQMWMRSPSPAPLHDRPDIYYASVTLHGTIMAYVLTTFFAMGFGYAVAATSLGRPIRGTKAAWIGFWICLVGTLMAAVTVLSGKASVLYTFYPPLLASPWYYVGAFLLIGGSMIWVVLMSINMNGWKRDNPGQPVPLAMFATTATAYLWAWAAIGVLLELSCILIPRAFGWTNLIDAALGRTLFSITLHAIVYFWLMPSYIAFYTIVPRAIGGRLYSDTMGRVAFVLFLVFSMPIGIHHLFADPQVGAGFKFLHAAFTAMVAVPTFLTVFTIVASVEIAARLRGGKGLFGWVKALPWGNPMMLAVTFSFIMLGLGGAGGIINMSFQLNETIHNTQWVTGHFHLIFAGAIVIMYFMVAYDLWPQLTGCKPLPAGLVKAQLWLWFVGMMVMTLPWHWVGLLGMPRRMAYFDFSNPALDGQAWTLIAGSIGGLMLVLSTLLFVFILARARRTDAQPAPFTFSTPVHMPAATPVALNGFSLWLALMIALTLVNYGFPIAQLAALKETSVPAIPIGGR